MAELLELLASHITTTSIDVDTDINAKFLVEIEKTDAIKQGKIAEATLKDKVNKVDNGEIEAGLLIAEMEIDLLTVIDAKRRVRLALALTTTHKSLPYAWFNFLEMTLPLLDKIHISHSIVAIS